MDIRHALAERAVNRKAQWLPIKVRKLPDPEKLKEIALLGAYSYSLPQSRRRLIKDTIQIEAGVEETPSAISRDYIRLIYKRGPRGTSKQLQNCASLPPVPNVAKPGKFAHGFYIDIKACYWSIMLIAGWNVDYNPGLWLAQGRPPKDFPFPEHKVGRNCLVSAGLMNGIPRYDPRKLPGDPYDEIISGNSLKNLQLPRLIHDILNSIGAECLQAGAIYLNNDGMIAPTPKVAETCQNIIEDWGLKYHVKADGAGAVKASGTYHVGLEKSLTYNLIHENRPLELLYEYPYARWLKSEFGFFAAGVL